MKELQEILESIFPLEKEKIAKGKSICDSLAKPLGALGKMEEIYQRLYAMYDTDIRLDKKIVMVYVADNGVVAEGISSNPQETTYIVGKNILKGNSGLGAISKHVGSDVTVIDIGCMRDIYSPAVDKVIYGTGNIVKESAMTREQAQRAILVGYLKTKSLIEESGYQVFGTGEMGIGNTTTSVAVICALLDIQSREIVGYGAGLTQDMLDHKSTIIQRSVNFHKPYQDVLDVVAKVGGLDMLGMVGTYLACAQYRKACVIDGLISITAVLIASKLCPHVLDYCFTSHASTEPGYQLVCQELQLDPMLLMDMRLGEGSGCPLAFFLLENAVYTIEHMPTFSESQLRKTDYIDIRAFKR